MLDRLQHSTLATRQFTADVGHELRTPLTGLGIDLESLRRNPDLPADQRAEMLDAMTVEHTRIVELLDGLQSLARGDARALPARSRVDIAELVQESVARARSRHARSHFNLHTELRSIPLVDGWREGLQLAIGNLLDNAAVHGRVGGNVEVTLSAPDKTVILTVTDDGPGIPAELRDRMRERFVRGPHTRGVGSGLGLALVDQQVALHGGTLTLNGPSSGGLLATLRLPTQHEDSC
jgi:signal transduction histidine kinase